MNPTKIKKILAISAVACLLTFAISGSASAAFEYKMLEGLPGFYQKGAAMPDLPDLIVSIYKFGIWTAGITVNRLNCKSATETTCTSLDGLKTSAVDNLIKLKKDCGTSCKVVVTGGTEGGHSSHSAGDKIDLRVDQGVKSFLLKNKNNLSSYGIKQICATDADASLRYGCTTREKEAHYHIAFGS